MGKGRGKGKGKGRGRGPGTSNEGADATTVAVEARASGGPAAVPLEHVAVTASPSSTPRAAPTSYLPIAAQREQVRTVLALGLLITLVLLALGYSSALLSGAVSASNVTKLLAGIFTPILGVFGAVTGFYYGSHASDGAPR